MKVTKLNKVYIRLERIVRDLLKSLQLLQEAMINESSKTQPKKEAKNTRRKKKE